VVRSAFDRARGCPRALRPMVPRRRRPPLRHATGGDEFSWARGSLVKTFNTGAEMFVGQIFCLTVADAADVRAAQTGLRDRSAWMRPCCSGQSGQGGAEVTHFTVVTSDKWRVTRTER